ncbi:MAG: MBL fold metallo-hydrolase [Eubacteriales bacterium]|nr:MBL fold metallo-hydrolase [Eubacteriales bacterium]
MQIKKIDDSTWMLDDGFVRGYLLAGTEHAILIDTCASSDEAKALAQSACRLPVVLVNTHGDGDHVAGNGAFDEFYMSEADYIGCRMAERCPESKLLPLNDGDVLDPGGRPLEIIAIPGHTLGSVAILDCKHRVLYSGDSVQDGHIYMFGEHRKPDAFAASLEKLTALEGRFDCIRPAHGTPELPAAFVRTVADAWRRVQSGEVNGHSETLHGRMVMTYDAEGCGFYCGE